MDASELIARLSPRERETLALLAEGHTNEAIAALLHVSVKTVESVCRSMFQKLDLADDRAINRRVLAARIHERALAPPSAPPVYGNAFVGRSQQLARVRKELAAGGLVAVVGPGGIGKTRLATEALRDRPDMPARWVDLTAVRSAEDVWRATFSAFGIDPRSESRAIRLLGERVSGSLEIVVLDGVDSQVSEVVEVVPVLRRLGCARLLLTSRQYLDLDGEVVVPLGSLEDEHATMLVRHRLEERDISSDLVAWESTDQLLELSRRCGNWPLALELAAVRVVDLGLERVSQLLDDLPSLLQVRGFGSRHGALEFVLRSAVAALSEQAHGACRRLAVLVGGFTSKVAQAVLGTDPMTTEQLLRELERSLFLTATGERLRMLEPVRQFALAELARCGEQQATERALITWAVSVADRAEHDSRRALSVVGPFLMAESDNLDAGIRTAIEQDDVEALLRILAGMGGFWGRTEPSHGVRRGADILGAVGERGPARLRARALTAAGGVATMARDWARSELWLDRAIALSASAGDERVELTARFWRLLMATDPEMLAVVRRLADKVGNDVVAVWARCLEAIALAEVARSAEASSLLVDARIRSEASMMPTLSGVVDWAQGRVMLATATDLRSALALSRRASLVFHSAGDLASEIASTCLSAHLAVECDDLTAAAASIETLAVLTERFGAPRVSAIVPLHVAAVLWHCDRPAAATALVERARRTMAATDASGIMLFRHVPQLQALLSAPDSSLDSDESLVSDALRLLHHTVTAASATNVD